MLIKLRFRFPEVFFGGLLAVAIFAMGALFWSSPNSSGPTQPQTDAKSGERGPGNKQEIAWWQDPVAVFTLGLVFIGLVQAGIFYGQMRLIRKSLAPAEQAAKAAQAAAEYIPIVEGAHIYVVIKKDEIFEHLQFVGKGAVDPDFVLTIQIALSNFGKTAAFIERFTARLSYASVAGRVLGFEAHIQPNTIIGAGDETEPPLRVSAPHLSSTDAQEIWRAAAYLILDGTLVYRDIWGGEWVVRFDGRTDNDSGRFRLDDYPRQKNIM
jgi:hypothetical protein